MTEKKGKSPRKGSGGSKTRRDRNEAAAGSKKPPQRKEWRAKDPSQTPRGGSRRKDESAAGKASERPSFAKRRTEGEERAARAGARTPRDNGESAGRRREGAASAPRRDDRPPRRREDQARDGGVKRARDFSASGPGERPSFAKRRAEGDERVARGGPGAPRENGENVGRRREGAASAPRRDDKPPRRREDAARDGGGKRARDFSASGPGERPSFTKRRTEGEERAETRSARPPREGGEGAGYRRDRFTPGPRSAGGAPRRAEQQNETRGGAAQHARKPGAFGPRKRDDAAQEKAFEGERIAKAMARAGACSRRDAEQWIAEGRVSVNGRRLSSPAFNVRESDSIEVDGRPLAERERTRLFLFHKPPGLVTSAKDPQGRKTVFDYIKELEPDLPRLMSVGRLDINTQGLLLLSNDGGLARALELPATGWKRRYRVRAHGETNQAALDQLAKGVEIEGVTYAPIEARIDRQQGANVWISMTLAEGKNREVKRVLGHLGLEVTRLIRVSFGPFQLGELDEGAIEEVRLKVLREQLGKSIAEFAGVDFASPLREPKTPARQEEARAAASRPRKHVSVLRRERDAAEAERPRTRIERATTADRKGRAVQIERVVVKGEKPAASSRNARRFAAERRETDAFATKRPPRDAKARDGAKPSRKPPRGEPRKPR
jgi:pseudouridine synthase